MRVGNWIEQQFTYTIFTYLIQPFYSQLLRYKLAWEGYTLSQLSLWGHLAITDTPIIRTAVYFLLFVNDMPLHVQKSTMDIYADDTTLSLSSNWKTLPLLNQSLSQDLNEVERWARENKMYLNMQKTKALLVTGKRLRKRMVQDPGKLGVKRITQKLNKSQTINWSDSAFYAILAPT